MQTSRMSETKDALLLKDGLAAQLSRSQVLIPLALRKSHMRLKQRKQMSEWTSDWTIVDVARCVEQLMTVTTNLRSS